MDNFKSSFASDKNDSQMNRGEIVKQYLSAFFKLPVLYEFNGFEIRDISQLDSNLSYVDSFVFNYSDEIFFWLQAIEDNIETHTGEFNFPLDKYEIIFELASIANIKDFETKNENEILLKYPNQTKELIEKSKKTFDKYYKQWEATVPNNVKNKSLFISWYYKEMGFHEWQDWKEIEDLLSNT